MSYNIYSCFEEIETSNSLRVSPKHSLHTRPHIQHHHSRAHAPLRYNVPMFGSSKEHDLLIHIGSGSVSGALVVLNNAGKPHILHTQSADFPVKEKENIQAEVLIIHMLSALHTVVTALWKIHRHNVSNVHIIFSSPWFSSFSKSIDVKKDAPFVVQPKIVEKLVGEQVASIFKTAGKNASSSPATSTATSAPVIIENAPSHIRINGYETTTPYGKTAHSLDVSVYVSTIKQALHDQIESEIYSVLHPKAVHFHTFPFAVWSILGPLFSAKEDYVLVDIGSEMTDAVLVRRGAIGSIVSFPIGKNQFARKVGLNFDIHPELSESLLNMYADKMADEQMAGRLETLITAFSEEWSARFHQAAAELNRAVASQENFLPQRAFFVSDANMSGIFGEIIGKQIPNITALSKENLVQFVEFGTQNAPNIFLALGTLYMNATLGGLQAPARSVK